ncbi:MAG: hypothetical protein GXO78_13950 [Calditrichaeota bacterium]|nr:hypothetical protein [Calditrichota bacterium]
MLTQSRIRFYIVGFSLSLLLALGCSSPTEETPEEDTGLEPRLSSIQANVFSKTCAVSGCHNSADKQAGLDLSPGKAYSNLVNVRSSQVNDLFRVKPGDPNNSYLIIKLEQDNPPQGVRMPASGNPLPQATIDVIRQWIADGAQNN